MQSIFDKFKTPFGFLCLSVVGLVLSCVPVIGFAASTAGMSGSIYLLSETKDKTKQIVGIGLGAVGVAVAIGHAILSVLFTDLGFIQGVADRVSLWDL